MVLSELFVKLGLDLDGSSFKRGLLAVEGVKHGFAVLNQAAIALGRGLLDITLGTVKSADHIDELAQSSGTTSTELQELSYAASFSSISMEDMTRSLGFLSKNMNEAALGNKELKQAFKSTGVATKNADGTLRSAGDVLGDLADHFASLPDGTEKTALSMKLFGRSGKQLIPFLNAGSAGIEKFREEARSLGVVLDEDTIKKSAELDDNLNRLENAWKGVKLSAASAFLPVLRGLVDSTLQWITANREFLAQKIATVLGAIFKVGKALWKVLGTVGKVVGYVADQAEALGIELDDVLTYAVYGLVAAFVAFKVAAVASAVATIASFTPVIATIAALAAGALLLAGAFTDADSAANQLLDQFNTFARAWANFSETDPPWLKRLKIIADGLLDAIQVLRNASEGNFGLGAEGTRAVFDKAIRRGERGDLVADRVRGFAQEAGVTDLKHAIGQTNRVALDRAAAAGIRVFNAPNISVTQLPGESGAQFAQRVVRVIEAQQERALRAAVAGVLQ